jgi:hypothetical protein
MKALSFWQAVVRDQSDFLIDFLTLLHDNGIQYCLIGGQAVNAYVEPLVSLDLDVAVVTEDLERLEDLLRRRFKVRRFPHTLNVDAPGSDLRVQIQTNPEFEAFPRRAALRNVLGLSLPVAALPDLLHSKLMACQEPTRRLRKRQKDLLDIARLIDAYPDLREQVPSDVLARLL